MKPSDKNQTRAKRHQRVRKTVIGTPVRPRLNVYRSTNHIYAQIIDDLARTTLVSAGSVDKGLKLSTGGNIDAARAVGAAIAERAKEAGISKVVFDRGGYLYHGRIANLADAAREAGLEF